MQITLNSVCEPSSYFIYQFGTDCLQKLEENDEGAKKMLDFSLN